jgi:hypothetical protein
MRRPIRGSLTADYWEAMRPHIDDSWMRFQAAVAPIGRLGDAELLNAVRSASAFMSLRVISFYNEHPLSVAQYVEALKSDYPALTESACRWTIDVMSANRRLYRRLASRIDVSDIRLSGIEGEMTLKALRRVEAVETQAINREMHLEEGMWPPGHLLVLKRYNR